jgi:hypothetical protein
MIKTNNMASSKSRAKQISKTIHVGKYIVMANMITDKFATFYGDIPSLRSDKPIDREMLRKHIEKYIK